MIRGGFVLVLLLCIQGISATELVVREHDNLVRRGTLFRLVIAREPAPSTQDGAHFLTVSLEQGGEAHVVQRCPLATVYQLDQGITIHLDPPRHLGPDPVVLRIRLEGGLGEAIETTVSVPTWTGVLDDLAQRSEALRNDASLGAIGQLLLERCQLATTRLPTQGRTDDILQALAWIDDIRAGASPDTAPLDTITCPVDGSIQPLRIYPCDTAAVGVLHVLVGHRVAVSKDRWPLLPTAWRQSAAEAGIVLVEWYPAGDVQWQGIARTRVITGIDTVLARHHLTELPQALLGVRSGALGALHVAAQDPQRFTALAVIEPSPRPPGPDLPAEVGAWFDTRDGLRSAAETIHGHMPIRLHGHETPSWQTVVSTMNLDAIRGSVDSLWPWLATRMPMGSPTVSEHHWTVLRPGRFGPIVVEAVERWGVPGHLHLHDRDASAPTIIGSNIAAWQWLGDQDLLPSASSLPEPGTPVPDTTLRRLGTALGPLDTYATQPFTVVVGRAGHTAADEVNRSLGQAFLNDWVAHAHGAPRWCWDDEFDPAAHSQRHLICIGNPTNNLVLKQFDDAAMPVQWDERELHAEGQRWRTGPNLAVALAVPRPDDPKHLLVVIDGGPGWERGGARAPLSGWPDLNIIPLPGYRDLGPTPAPVQRFLDNRWR